MATAIFIPMGLTQSADVSAVGTMTITNYGEAQTLRLTVIGTQTVYILFNDSVNTATVSNAMPIQANSSEVFTLAADSSGGVTIQHVSDMAGSTLYVTTGIGN